MYLKQVSEGLTSLYIRVKSFPDGILQNLNRKLDYDHIKRQIS